MKGDFETISEKHCSTNEIWGWNAGAKNKNGSHWAWWVESAPQYKQFGVSEEVDYNTNAEKKTQ